MTNTEHRPGSRLRRFAERTFERQTLERVILPALEDLRHECENRDGGAETSTGVRARSRIRIRVRAYWGLWKTLVICFAGDAVRDRQGHARSLGARTLLFALLLLVLLTAAQSTTWSYSFGRGHGAWAAIKAVFLLMPSTLTMVLPGAFFLALALFRTKNSRVGTLIPSATVSAVACATALFIGAMFVVPPINQSFRTFVFNTLQLPDPGVPPRVLSKGLAELTWTELNAEIRKPTSSRQQELARAHRQQRFALVGSAFVMALLGLGVAGRWRSRTATIGASLVLLVLYAGCFTLAADLNRGGDASAYGTWTANIAFAVVGLRRLRSRKECRDDAISVRA
jgi:Lipopolysaccharide export system permease LptF/LptG